MLIFTSIPVKKLKGGEMAKKKSGKKKKK